MINPFQSLPWKPIILVSIVAVTSAVRGEETLEGWAAENLLPALTEPTPPPVKLQTFFGNQGLRGIFNEYGGKLSPEIIQPFLKNDLFLAGPHKDGTFTVDSTLDFGRYNPKAIREIGDTANVLLKDETFVRATQHIYDRRFRDLARLFFRAYVFCCESEDFEPAKKKYLDTLGTKPRRGFGFEKGLDRAFSHSLGEENVKWGSKLTSTEALTAVRFWVRRSIDGTDIEFARCLVRLIRCYDPAFPIPEGRPLGTFEAKVEADVGPNSFTLNTVSADVPEEEFIFRIRLDEGSWRTINNPILTPIPEGVHKLEIQPIWTPFTRFAGAVQTLEIEIEGDLKPKLDTLIEGLNSNDLRLRKTSAEQLLLHGRFASKYLRSRFESASDIELRARLARVLQAIE